MLPNQDLSLVSTVMRGLTHQKRRLLSAKNVLLVSTRTIRDTGRVKIARWAKFAPLPGYELMDVRTAPQIPTWTRPVQVAPAKSVPLDNDLTPLQRTATLVLQVSI